MTYDIQGWTQKHAKTRQSTLISPDSTPKLTGRLYPGILLLWLPLERA